MIPISTNNIHLTKSRKILLEKSQIQEIMHMSQTNAAKTLGVSVSTLKRRMNELGLRWPRIGKDKSEDENDSEGEDEKYLPLAHQMENKKQNDSLRMMYSDSNHVGPQLTGSRGNGKVKLKSAIPSYHYSPFQKSKEEQFSSFQSLKEQSLKDEQIYSHAGRIPTVKPIKSIPALPSMSTSGMPNTGKQSTQTIFHNNNQHVINSSPQNLSTITQNAQKLGNTEKIDIIQKLPLQSSIVNNLGQNATFTNSQLIPDHQRTSNQNQPLSTTPSPNLTMSNISSLHSKQSNILHNQQSHLASHPTQMNSSYSNENNSISNINSEYTSNTRSSLPPYGTQYQSGMSPYPPYHQQKRPSITQYNYPSSYSYPSQYTSQGVSSHAPLPQGTILDSQTSRLPPQSHVPHGHNLEQEKPWEHQEYVQIPLDQYNSMIEEMQYLRRECENLSRYYYSKQSMPNTHPSRSAQIHMHSLQQQHISSQHAMGHPPSGQHPPIHSMQMQNSVPIQQTSSSQPVPPVNTIPLPNLPIRTTPEEVYTPPPPEGKPIDHYAPHHSNPHLQPNPQHSSHFSTQAPSNIEHISHLQMNPRQIPFRQM